MNLDVLEESEIDALGDSQMDLAKPVDGTGADEDMAAAAASVTLQLAPGEGVCCVCDKDFEDIYLSTIGLIPQAYPLEKT